LIFINCVTNVHAKQFQDTLYNEQLNTIKLHTTLLVRQHSSVDIQQEYDNVGCW